MADHLLEIRNEGAVDFAVGLGLVDAGPEVDAETLLLLDKGAYEAHVWALGVKVHHALVAQVLVKLDAP